MSLSVILYMLSCQTTGDFYDQALTQCTIQSLYCNLNFFTLIFKFQNLQWCMHIILPCICKWSSSAWRCLASVNYWGNAYTCKIWVAVSPLMLQWHYQDSSSVIGLTIANHISSLWRKDKLDTFVVTIYVNSIVLRSNQQLMYSTYGKGNW